MKHSEISDDGQIQSTIEHYVDGSTSIARVTANFRGKTGAMTFRATKEGVTVAFSGDDITLGAAGDLRMTGDNATITANNVSVDAEEELLLSSGSRVTIQALSDILSLVSAKKMSIGSNDQLQVTSLRGMLIKTLKQLQIIASSITLQAGIVRIGTGIFPVARVGDSVSVTGTTGIITGPGSTKLFAD